MQMQDMFYHFLAYFKAHSKVKGKRFHHLVKEFSPNILFQETVEVCELSVDTQTSVSPKAVGLRVVTHIIPLVDSS